MPEEAKKANKLMEFLLTRKQLLLVTSGGLLLGGLLCAGLYRTQGPLKASLVSGTSIQATDTVELALGQEVASGISASVSPAVKGSWQQKRSLLGVNSLVFTPATRFESGEQYTVQLTNMKRLGTGAPIPNTMRTFKVAMPPGFSGINIKPDAKDVPVKQRFTVTLAAANKGHRDLKASLSPAAALKLVANDDRTYSWEPTTALTQGTTYTFALDDAYIADAKKARLATVSFTTVAAPTVKSTRTGNLFGKDEVINIVFNQPMEAKTTNFVFDFAGKGSWVDDVTYRYAPAGLVPGKTYKYRITPGLTSKVGGVTTAELAYEFATNGAVTGTVTPGGGGIAVNAAIRISFDQAVEHASAESRFSISPTVKGAFAWSGNTMTFTPAGLGYQTAYTATLAKGVVPSWGLPSSRAMTGTFETVAQTIKLSLTGLKTQHWMSCELTSLRMLMQYRGINIPKDTDLLSRVGYNPRHRDTTTNSWDDPNVMYVGDIDGRPGNTGYGVHAGPIASAARSYGRNATAYYGVSSTFLASQIHGGNPVMFYGHSGGGRLESWNGPSGLVKGVFPQHARVIYGVVGKPDNPLGFHLIEPISAKSEYWTTAKVMANMNIVPGVSNQAVVVY